MRKIISFSLLLIVLASCASPAPKPISELTQSPTLTTTATATSAVVPDLVLPASAISPTDTDSNFSGIEVLAYLQQKRGKQIKGWLDDSNYKFVDNESNTWTVPNNNIVYLSDVDCVRITDELGNIWVWEDNGLIRVNYEDSGTFVAKNLQGDRTVIVTPEGQVEYAIPFSNQDLDELYGVGKYSFDAETGALMVKGSDGQMREMVAVGVDGGLIIHMAEGDRPIEREQIHKTEINLLGHKYIMTVDVPGETPVGKLIGLEKTGLFVEAMEVSSKNGDWTEYEEVTLDQYSTGEWVYSMALQIPNDLRNASPVDLYWQFHRLGGGIAIEDNYTMYGGSIEPGSPNDGARPAFDTRQVFNPDTGENFPVEAMVMMLGENGPFYIVPRNRAEVFADHTQYSGHTILEKEILDHPESMDARDGILLYSDTDSDGTVPIYEYFTGAEVSRQIEATKLVGNDFIDYTTPSGGVVKSWVLDKRWVTEGLVRKIIDLRLNDQGMSEKIELTEDVVRRLVELQYFPVPVLNN